MKTLFVFILLCSGLLRIHAQTFTVQAEKMNIAYMDTDNPLTIVSEDYSCDQIIASCDHGTLTKVEGCHYNFIPDQQGTCDIVVSAKTKTGTKLIGKVKYRVKYIPRPVAVIGGRSEGKIATAVFKAQSGVSVSREEFDFDFRMRVTSFKMEFYRNGEILYNGFANEALFNEEIRKQIKNLKPGDKISVTEIRAVGPSSRVVPLNDINLTLN